MKNSLTFAILGLITAVSFSAHARRVPGAVAYAKLECTKTAGFYPANVLYVQGAVSEADQVVAAEDDPNGYVLEFQFRGASWGNRVNLVATRAFAGNYYSSYFACTEVSDTVAGVSK